MKDEEPPRVLLVDDEPGNLLALQAVLEPLELDVRLADSGSAALRALLAHDAAVIVLDVMMPDMDGFEVATHIKRRERVSDAAIIFLTALGTDAVQRTRGYASGAVDYLAKPVDPDLLRSKVSVFVQLHRQRELLRRRTAELERSNAELDQFAHVVSHDLQEPLRALRSFLALVDASPHVQTGADEREFLQRAISAADRMSEMIDDLLDLARLDRPADERSPVALPDVLAAVVDDLAATLTGTSARVETGNLPVVHGWFSQLVQLFSNLIGNALKFRAEQDPVVRIEAVAEGEWWRISVLDNGIGIPVGQREKVFGMFERLHTRDSFPGSGLGLAIARRVVGRHGGRIWIEDSPMGGTAVHLTLPAWLP